MGDDVVDYFRDHSRLGHIVARLSAIPEPPKYPEQLADLISKRCGHDIEFDLFQLDPRGAGLRAMTHDHLLTIKREVDALFNLGLDTDSIYPFNFALPALVDEHASGPAEEISVKLYQALEVIHYFPLVSDRKTLQGRPPASERVNNLVRAIAAYLKTFEREEYTVNIPNDPSGKKIFKSRAAHLTKEVALCLNLGITETELATSLKNLRAELGGKLSA